MKLHLHRTNGAEKVYEAYTRDKAGTALNKKVIINKDGETRSFYKSDWKYIRANSIDIGEPGTHGHEIKTAINLRGFSISEIKYFPHKIFVFDIDFDQIDTRVYSLDEDLNRFRRQVGDLVLSPEGRYLGFDKVKFVDTIRDRFYFEILSLGIDLQQIVERGFVLTKVLEVGVIEQKRRYIQRGFREAIPEINKQLVKEFGVEITEFKLDSLVEVPKPSEDVANFAQVKTEKVSEKNTLPNPASISPPPKAVRHKFTWIKIFYALLVLIAATIIPILQYFEIKPHTILEVIKGFFRNLIAFPSEK